MDLSNPSAGVVVVGRVLRWCLERSEGTWSGALRFHGISGLALQGGQHVGEASFGG